jgi:hypothetical protein
MYRYATTSLTRLASEHAKYSQTIIKRGFSTTAPWLIVRISETVIKEHRELSDNYERILSASTPDERVRYQNLFIWQLARHAVGEELVVYPAVERHVEGGTALAERERAETQKVCRTTLCSDGGVISHTHEH